MQRLKCVGAVFALALVGSAAAGVGVWTTNGPHGGRIFDVVISPQSPNNLYLAATRGGVFRTTNGGGSWTRAEAGLPGNLLAGGLDAASSGTSVAYVFVSGTGIVYRTADFGLSWFPLPAPWVGTNVPRALDVAQGDGSILAVTTGDRVYASTNNGSSWTASPPGAFALGAMDHVAIAANGDIYAAASSYDPAGYDLEMVRKSTDGGLTWAAAGPLPDTDPTPGVSPLLFVVRGIATAPSDANRLYAFGVGGGAATSGDAGATWSQIQLPLDCSASQFSVDPTTAETAWVQCGRGSLHRTNDASIPNPVWVEVEPGATNYTINGTDPAQAATLTFHPNYPATPHLLIGTEDGGILRSTNNGALWLERNTGIEATVIRALATHPLDSSVVLAGYGDAFSTAVSIYRSSDGGASWAPSINGLNAEQIRALAIDPTTVDGNSLTAEDFHVYAVGRSEPTPDFSAIDGGIYKSTTAGNSWSTIDNGIATLEFFTPGGPVNRAFMGTVRSVVLDPRSCDAPPASGPCPAVVPPTAASTLKTVLVGGSGRLSSSVFPGCADTVEAARIYRSTDAGANWVASDSGIPIGQDLDPGDPGNKCVQIGGIVPVVIDPNNPLVLYAGTFLGVFDPAFPVEPTLDNGLFKSVDGGLTWAHSSNGLPRVGGPTSSHWDVLSIAIAPDNSNRLYATAISFDRNPIEGRVYRSDDAGATWVRADTGIAGSDVRALLVDPQDATGNTVYAGAGGTAANPGGVYQTTDGGLTWNSYSIGLQADAALALAIPDRPLGDPFRLLAGTVSGTWEFTEPNDPDGDGAATAIEDASPGPKTTGDGNDDGTPDADQSSVASNAGQVFRLAGGAGTAERGGGNAVEWTLAITGGACGQINNSEVVDPGFLPIDPASGEYPLGLIRFEMPNCAQAELEVVFHGADFDPEDWRWRNFGPTIPGDESTFAWYDLGARAEQIDSQRWRLTLDAGQFGVYRDSDTNILMLGGPIFTPNRIFGDRFESP